MKAIDVVEIGKAKLSSRWPPQSLWRAQGKVNKFPWWFIKALKSIGKAEIYRGGAYAIFGAGFIDHGGKFMTPDGAVAAVTEPYEIGLEDLEEIVELCKENDLYCRISGCTEHYPTRTLSIRFYQKREEASYPRQKSVG